MKISNLIPYTIKKMVLSDGIQKCCQSDHRNKKWTLNETMTCKKKIPFQVWMSVLAKMKMMTRKARTRTRRQKILRNEVIDLSIRRLNLLVYIWHRQMCMIIH